MHKKDNKYSGWANTGWPWELEILAIVLAALSIFVPYLLAELPATIPEDFSFFEQRTFAVQQGLEDLQKSQADFIWLLVVPILYLVHILLARSGASQLVSTPLVHLFTPIVFSLIFYFRCASRAEFIPSIQPLFTGSPLQVTTWLMVIVLVVLVVARVRMARYMVNFKDTEWMTSTHTRTDKSFWQLVMYVQPLVYRPRAYHAFEKGIIIEGWLYIMAVPFSAVQGIDRIDRNAYLPSGYYIATSRNSLLRIKLTDFQTPLLISPSDIGTFGGYCKERVMAYRMKKYPSLQKAADKAA